VKAVKRVWIAALVLAALATPLLAGCSATKTDTSAQQKAECAQNQRMIRLAMDAVYADTQVYPSIDTVVQKADVKCPSGGTYTYDPTTNTVSCSVHGHL
jgi:hypothetical protein